jgi:hypothetical protein
VTFCAVDGKLKTLQDSCTMQTHFKRIQRLFLATLTAIFVISASAQAQVIVVNADEPDTVRPEEVVKPGDRLIVNFVERKYSRPADKDRSVDPNTYYVWDYWRLDQPTRFLKLTARRESGQFPWESSPVTARTVTFDFIVGELLERWLNEEHDGFAWQKLAFVNNSFATKVILPEGRTSRGPERFEITLKMKVDD